MSDNVPHHDLHVTKAHSLYLDGVLIPVEYLVNHRAIIWDDRAQEVAIYHIELETHDLLIANGAPTESYRDDGNRWLFWNSNSGWGLPPQPPYAEVVTGGPIVDAVWRRLLERSGPRPHMVMTDDPDLHLLVDGKRIHYLAIHDGVYTFRVSHRPGNVRLVSRAVVPHEAGFHRDSRLLGVALRRAVVWRGARLRLIDADNPDLSEGFHSFEADNNFRWTNGNALLPAAMFDMNGACEVELHIADTTRYPLLAEPEHV